MSSFLIDMPLTPKLVDWLILRGHSAVHAKDCGLSVAKDEVILARARETGSVVITADLDYPRLLAITGRASPGVILLRGGTFSDIQMIDMVERVLKMFENGLIEGSFVVVDQTRIRIRQLPL